MEQPKSEFNDALGLLTRCDAIFRGLIESKQSQELYDWHMLLINLLMELSADMDEDKFKEVLEKLGNLNNDVSIWTRKKENEGKKVISMDTFNKMIMIEKELKDIYAKCGYRTKMQSDAAKALR